MTEVTHHLNPSNRYRLVVPPDTRLGGIGACPDCGRPVLRLSFETEAENTMRVEDGYVLGMIAVASDTAGEKLETLLGLVTDTLSPGETIEDRVIGVLSKDTEHLDAELAQAFRDNNDYCVTFYRVALRPLTQDERAEMNRTNAPGDLNELLAAIFGGQVRMTMIDAVVDKDGNVEVLDVDPDPLGLDSLKN